MNVASLRALPSILAITITVLGLIIIITKETFPRFRLFVFVARETRIGEKGLDVFSVPVEYSATKYNHDLH